MVGKVRGRAWPGRRRALPEEAQEGSSSAGGRARTAELEGKKKSTPARGIKGCVCACCDDAVPSVVKYSSHFASHGESHTAVGEGSSSFRRKA